ncbi:hypothetical protein ACWC4J_17380 [Streptomyces sp. NPDC001356]
MKHTHMAVGLIPEDLVNLAVVVHWTPGDARYTVALFDAAGNPLEDLEFEGKATEEFDYDPPVLQLDMAVYHGLAHWSPLPARLVQALGGFGFFQWFGPATMTSKAREKFEVTA